MNGARQLKSLIRYPLDHWRAQRVLTRKPAPTRLLTARPLALDLSTTQLAFDCGRHLAALAHHASEAGSQLLLRCDRRILAVIVRKQHGREMLAHPAVHWLDLAERLPDDALVFCDTEPAERGQRLRLLVGRTIDRSVPVMPYPMHPATLGHADHRELLRLRTTAARRGILFAGNQKPKYGAAKIEAGFHVLNRIAITTSLADEFPDRVQYTPGGTASERPIMLVDTNCEAIDSSQWLPTLASAQFFVCCPGASQPMCHNLIEAMSVGTIPIIEYSDRVTPELCDGEQAICFQGRSGLIDAVQRIDAMDAEMIQRLSENAAHFYDQHLCLTKFLIRLRDEGMASAAGQVCLPFHEYDFYQSDVAVNSSQAA